MISNVKRLIIAILLLRFIFCVNELIDYHIERENTEIISDNLINLNHKTNSFLSFANSGYILYYSEMFIKYIFNEDGFSKNYQIKYVNRGDSDNCTITENLTYYYDISDIKID